MAPKADSTGGSRQSVSSADLNRQTNPFVPAYSLSVETLNDINKMLQRCGTETLVSPLPKIAVIGNQSSGKSSLIEAISKIKVPRSKGTTTRCPMEVILRRRPAENDRWSCRMSVRSDNYLNDRTLRKNFDSSTFADPFATTETPASVSLLIRRAQLAVLNPGKAPDSFKNMDEDTCRAYTSELPFSPDVVVVEISKADIDVTFIDLPGIIANTSDREDVKCIELTKDLAISYAKQDQCLILVTASMEDELSNQAALKIAKDCDPPGLQTLDTPAFVPSSNYPLQLPSPKPTEFKRDTNLIGSKLLHAPDPEGQPAKTWEDDREEERKLVENQPWCQLRKERLGTRALAVTLSKRLADMIKRRLPNLRAEIGERLSTVQKDMESLPESFAENPQNKLWQLCSEFNNRIREYTTGSDSPTEFFESLYQEFERFSEAITATRPKFEIPQKTNPNESQNIKRISQSVREPSLSYPSTPPSEEKYSRGGSDVGPVEDSQVITLQDVKEVLRKRSICSLPTYFPTGVLRHFIDSFTSKWSGLCLQSFKAAERLLKEVLEELCEEFFTRFKSSGLLDDLSAVVFAVMKKVADETRNQIRLICSLEANRPFTMNGERFIQSRDQYLIDFAHARRPPTSPPNISRTSRTSRDNFGNSTSVSHEEMDDGVLLGHLNAKGYKISDIKQLALLDGHGEYEAELNVISGVLAHFDVASNRLTQIIPMIFEGVFARTFERELRDVLAPKLELVGDHGAENCRRYTKDAEDVDQRREKLTRNKQVISEALEILDRWRISSGSEMSR